MLLANQSSNLGGKPRIKLVPRNLREKAKIRRHAEGNSGGVFGSGSPNDGVLKLRESPSESRMSYRRVSFDEVALEIGQASWLGNSWPLIAIICVLALLNLRRIAASFARCVCKYIGEPCFQDGSSEPLKILTGRVPTHEANAPSSMHRTG